MKEKMNQNLEALHDSLHRKHSQKQTRPLPKQEKEKLKQAIQTIKYPGSMQNILHFINQEIATLLAASSNQTLKEWGSPWKSFYLYDQRNTSVDAKTGIVRKDEFDMYPEWIQKLRIKRLSPIHIAAAIGDTALIESLMSQGVGLADVENVYQIIPLDYAISFGQNDTILFLIKNSPKDFKKVVEKCSFELIDTLLKMDIPITSKVLDAALKRDHELHHYLNQQRKTALECKINKNGSLNTLKSILNCPVISIQSLIDVIRIEPRVLYYVDKSSGNTLLHQLAIDNESTKLINLLDAIFQSNSLFDIDEKNEHGQTLLDLVLPYGRQDNCKLISEILLFDPILKQRQRSALEYEYGINLNVIAQTREKKLRYLVGRQSQHAEIYQELLENTHLELKATRHELAELKKTLEQQNQQLQLQQKMLEQLLNQQKPLISEQSNHPNIFFTTL